MPAPVPERLPNVLAMDFSETYALFKTAPAESLRSYYLELVSLRPKPRRRAALATFFKTLVHVDSALTKELILALEGDDRWAALYAIRDAAPPRAMHAVAEVLLSYDRSQISGCSWDLLREMLDDWGRNDPLALKEFLDSHRDQDVERYYTNLVRNWAAYDPDAAWQWMNDRVPEPPRPRSEGADYAEEDDTTSVAEMQATWVEGYVQYDPDGAINYVVEHAADEAISAAISSVAAKVFTISAERARDLIVRLPDELRSTALAGISNEANRFIRSDAKDNSTSPRAVAEWMLQFPQPEWQPGIGSALREWEHGDAQELFGWMSDLPAPTRKAVVAAYPLYVTADSAQQDVDAIMQARDPVLRTQLLEKMMRRADRAREAVLVALEKANLPAEQRAHLAGLIPAAKHREMDDSDLGEE